MLLTEAAEGGWGIAGTAYGREEFGALAAAAAMRPYVFSDTVETEVRRNLHGDSSGVRGAAWLWPDD